MPKMFPFLFFLLLLLLLSLPPAINVNSKIVKKLHISKPAIDTVFIKHLCLG